LGHADAWAVAGAGAAVLKPHHAVGEQQHGGGDADRTGADYDVLQWDSRQDCEVRQMLDRIADKWSLRVIPLLDRRRLRFTELRRMIDGISQRMLTRTLRHLERDGLVTRTVPPCTRRCEHW